MPTLRGQEDPEAFLDQVAAQANGLEQPITIRLTKQLYDWERRSYYADKRASIQMDFKDAEEVRAFERCLGLFMRACKSLKKLEMALMGLL